VAARSFDFAQDDGQKEAGASQHAILPNEPTVFWRHFVVMTMYNLLEKKYAREIGGFVFENEPTGEGFRGSGSELGENYREIHVVAYPLCQRTPGSVDGGARIRATHVGVVDLGGGFC